MLPTTVRVCSRWAAPPLVALTLLSVGPAAEAAGGGVRITSFGHSALLIEGGGARVLLNPFRSVGCAAGLAEPRVSADVILASSRLKDEGASVASGRLLNKPGSYKVAGLQIEGVGVPHDRVNGRRFGQSTVWRWRQGGLDFAHLGGTAGAISPADKVLLGRPDVLVIGVGGGAKVYTGAEAAAVVRELNPRRVIPVQFVRGGQPPADCDQGGLQPFLEALGNPSVRQAGASLSLTPPLPEGTVVEVMR
ncbi:MAG: MBL fold metallo-hydrolase [Cyanobacteriota bacterium]|jgi:L-ascorbate metabolism protein UlaG (beta-lactamase superfamily)